MTINATGSAPGTSVTSSPTPRMPTRSYVLNTGMFRSGDAGKTFTLLPAPHGDHHGLWIDSANPRRMINGDDGGATVSLDGGQTWSTQYNQPRRSSTT